MVLHLKLAATVYGGPSFRKGPPPLPNPRLSSPKAFVLIESLSEDAGSIEASLQPTGIKEKKGIEYKPCGEAPSSNKKRISYKKEHIGKVPTGGAPFSAGTNARRAASPPVEIFAGGGPGEGAFYKKRPPPVLSLYPYSIQFAARPTARCQLWSSSARRSSSIEGSKRRSSFHRVDTSSSLSQKPTASPAR